MLAPSRDKVGLEKRAVNGDILTGLVLRGGGSALWPGRCSCGHLCGFFGDLLMGPSLLGDTYLSRGGTGSPLVVQWLRLGSFTAMAGVWSWVWELRSYKLCGEKKEKKMHCSLLSFCLCILLCPQWAPSSPLFMISFQTSQGQHFYHGFISTCRLPPLRPALWFALTSQVQSDLASQTSPVCVPISRECVAKPVRCWGDWVAPLHPSLRWWMTLPVATSAAIFLQ